ncbi:hypothetical protein [Agromyces humi]|uniref:hypothetical protein n=1 Tax=Agromyces humi TaxID=1766800 RepID=UPI00135676CF|nr:hypothetical protein [Agromyces humi]
MTGAQIAAPVPFGPIRERFTVDAVKTSGEKGWPVTQVTVFDAGAPVFTFERRYSFLHTFEPFRQWDGQQWRNYALIAPKYTTFAVLDLDSRQIIAERPMPTRQIPEEWFDQYPERFKEGKWLAGKQPGDHMQLEGFCPADFYVPDFASEIGFADAADWDKHATESWFQDEIALKQGQFGFYSGCVWGDDTSHKLRYIDLSRISEGVVTDDERFGYWEVPDRGRLSEHINIDDTFVTVNTRVTVDLERGASPWSRDGIRWAERDD